MQFECCGFMSTRDQPYPFPDAQYTSNAYVQQYGYTRPCAPALEAATQYVSLTLFPVTFLSVIVAQIFLAKIRFRYIVVRLQIMNSEFPQVVRDTLDRPETNENSEKDIKEKSQLLATAVEDSGFPGLEGSLVQSVEN